MTNSTLKNNHNVLSSKNNRTIMSKNRFGFSNHSNQLPEILFITSYPPRQCGIATYSEDLIAALNNKFEESFEINVCGIETKSESFSYSEKVKYVLSSDNSNSYIKLASKINKNTNLQIVLIQHEFGLFKNNEADFIDLLKNIDKPIITVFHTVLPKPNPDLQKNVKEIAQFSESIIVMTNAAAKILADDYNINREKITVIPHGTHLVQHIDKDILKQKYNLENRIVLTTFGLLSSGKCIETTLDALPEIVKSNPTILFLIIGKTHPSVVKQEREKYRDFLKAKIEKLKLQNHVRFVNEFLPLETLLEYLQLTDIYLFTSKDPNQAVSGTFSYAMSCGCAIISTPIPHANEFLKNKNGIIIDFENSDQLASEVNILLRDEDLRKKIISNGLHKITPTAWENSAIAHALLFEKISKNKITLHYKIPEINLNHIQKMTTKFGMIQFSVINQPDINSGFTLDDNARALVAFCQHYKLTNDENDLKYIKIYLDFIQFCLVNEGCFLNYVDEKKKFTEQNKQTNLADSNGRVIWALGYAISISDLLPIDLEIQAKKIMQTALKNIDKIHSTRAMAFVIKGVYYSNTKNYTPENILLIKHFSNRLIQMYKHETSENWQWFESYLTYANSIIPEAMLCAYLATRDIYYKEIAILSFDFLLSKTFKNNRIKVISNKGWLLSKENQLPEKIGGEQPIDVAYTILALSKFYDAFGNEDYKQKMEMAFDWFLGKNHLNQIIYNPCTGGCYDGLEDHYINLNQGAESTESYLMARLTIEKYRHSVSNNKTNNLRIKNDFFAKSSKIAASVIL